MDIDGLYFTKREVVNIHVMEGDFPAGTWTICPMSTDNKSIGARLVAFRDALGISQIDVCKSIGIKANRYSQYETGERRITLSVATKLVLKYGLTLDWIYLDNAAGLPGHLHQKILRAA